MTLEYVEISPGCVARVDLVTPTEAEDKLLDEHGYLMGMMISDEGREPISRPWMKAQLELAS